MSLVEFNWSPTNRQLRQFGVVSAFALPLIVWVWSAPLGTIGLFALLGSLIAAVAWLRPRFVKPLFIALATIATPIGIVVGELVMLLIYGLVFIPMGLWFRIIRRDALRRNREAANSYWEPVRQPNHVASYYRQS